MAPEVAIGKNYNEACDVYSFTLLLWEMLALELPYESIHSQAEFIEKVFGDGQRPPLSKKWSQSLKDLFEGGWREDPLERLKISAVKNRLREELILHRGVTEDLDDGVGRRRSTYVYRRKAKAL